MDEDELRGAIGSHDTAITEGEWDGPGAVASMPNDAATLRYCHAWMESGGDAEAKSSYKFPHHRTKGGPANLPGVRNALARLPGSKIPEADKAGVERHLRSHLDKQEEKSLPAEAPPAEASSPEEVERRFVVEELRVMAEEGEKPRIEGYAAVFGKRSEVLGDFVEQIEAGFFAPALRHDVRALWNHNTDLVLGRTKNKTLRLEEDERGLGVVINPPDTQWGRDAIELIRRGDVNQMSFGFSVRPGGDEWSKEGKGLRVRTLKAGGCKALYDVSPVTFPAYPQTTAQVRAMVEQMSHSEDDEPRQEPEDGTGKLSLTLRQAQRRRRLEIEKLR